jgi:SAM-dependent methyltransferase
MNCRMCFGPTRTMLKLTPTPIANSFPDHPDTDAPRYPLDLAQCVICDHVQLADFKPVDWVDYRYATPDAVRPHLVQAAQALRTRYPKAKTVLEIGCNNGLYLDVLRNAGFEATGIDPCTKVGIAKSFSSKLADTLEPVDLIVANNVLAHVDDLWDVFRGIDRLLKDDGVLVFEVQHFYDLVTAGAFDMVYHEHRDYHTFAPWPRFLKRWGLVVDYYEHLSTHGGSLRFYCRRPGYATMLPDYPIDWRGFKATIAEAKQSVLEQITACDGPIIAFGATAKACTLIHHFGLADFIDFAMDNTPAKQGRYIPGTKIKIVAPGDLMQAGPGPEQPVTYLLTAWNFEKEIRAQYPQHRFIVPFKKESLCLAS